MVNIQIGLRLSPAEAEALKKHCYLQAQTVTSFVTRLIRQQCKAMLEVDLEEIPIRTHTVGANLNPRQLLNAGFIDGEQYRRLIAEA